MDPPGRRSEHTACQPGPPRLSTCKEAEALMNLALMRGGHDNIWLLEADDSEILARLGRFYIPRRDPRYLRRNALVALGNTGDAAALPLVERYGRSDDPMLADPNDPRFYCLSCANEAVDHEWLPVRWPTDKDEIEVELLKRPDEATQSWIEGQTTQNLQDENKAKGLEE